SRASTISKRCSELSTRTRLEKLSAIPYATTNGRSICHSSRPVAPSTPLIVAPENRITSSVRRRDETMIGGGGEADRQIIRGLMLHRATPVMASSAYVTPLLFVPPTSNFSVEGR